MASSSTKKPKITVTLQEFTMLVLPSAETNAGTVRMKVINKGTLTHEMVLVRAASVTALPKVTTGGGARWWERSMRRRFPSGTRWVRPAT